MKIPDKFIPKLICPECLEEYDDEPRVKAGMKCGKCAYSEWQWFKKDEIRENKSKEEGSYYNP